MWAKISGLMGMLGRNLVVQPLTFHCSVWFDAIVHKIVVESSARRAPQITNKSVEEPDN